MNRELLELGIELPTVMAKIFFVQLALLKAGGVSRAALDEAHAAKIKKEVIVVILAFMFLLHSKKVR